MRGFHIELCDLKILFGYLKKKYKWKLFSESILKERMEKMKKVEELFLA